MATYLLRIALAIAFLSGIWENLQAQTEKAPPEFEISPSVYESHVRFLASDELKGRRAGSEGNAIAARYIAEKFRTYGLKEVQGAEGYFQQIPFLQIVPAQGGSVQIQEKRFSYGEDLIWLSSRGYSGKSEAIWVGNGWMDEEAGINDYAGKSVAGKIVVMASGFPGASSSRQIWKATAKKRVFAKQMGALAIVEVYRERTPWQFMKRRFMGERLTVLDTPTPTSPSDGLPHVLIQEKDKELESILLGGEVPQIQFEGKVIKGRQQILNVPNVLGIIEGSDPDLKSEYVLLTAHFDHVGVGKQGGATTPTDSIFNGARDNGMGVAALLGAAYALSSLPPRRSVICMAVNAEEMGLLGSAYYAENPLIPLKQTVFNLNTDGAGYTDTLAVSIMGMDRVGAKEELENACQAFGLNFYIDPAPEANLFDRSDNVSFARKGIPAPTLSPGFSEFGQELFAFYHQVTDQVESLNWAYVSRYAKTYAYAARLIANKDSRPLWIEGDKYEEAAKKLYGY